MSEKKYFFDEQSTRRLSRNLLKSETALNKLQQKPSKKLQTNFGSVFVSINSDGIGGRDDSTIFSAECDLIELDKETGEYKLLDEKISCWNLSDSFIRGGVVSIATRDRSGNFIIDKAVVGNFGMIRVSFHEGFSESDNSVSCRIVKSEIEGFDSGSDTTVANSIGLASDAQKRGFAYVYEDGSVELVNAECPDVD